LFTELKPDLFLGYTIKPVVYGSLAAAHAGVPGIYSMITGLGSAFSGSGIKAALIRRLVIFLYRRALRHNARVFFQNPDDIALFSRMGILKAGEQAVRIPGSGVDVHEFQPAPFPKGLSFLLIARLLREKGIAEYAEAARRIRQHHPHVRFRLAGWLDENPDSIREDELQAWVDEGTLEYLGRLDDVRPALADSSVFVLPSYYREGIPRTLLEALAMGRPIITTDMPGCRLTVKDGENGYLAAARDAHALAEAMERFIEQPEMIAKMGVASRSLAETQFDVHIVNKIILKSMGLA
jgi:glycosyltransferase involved in cell wall biosynthesis